ncbi:hypothetical protein Q7P37_000859 [Cladosporium fusiforme]
MDCDFHLEQPAGGLERLIWGVDSASTPEGIFSSRIPLLESSGALYTSGMFPGFIPETGGAALRVRASVRTLIVVVVGAAPTGDGVARVVGELPKIEVGHTGVSLLEIWHMALWVSQQKAHHQDEISWWEESSMCFAIGRWECGIERLPHTSARERQGGQAGRHGRFAIQGQRRKMPLLLWGRAVGIIIHHHSTGSHTASLPAHPCSIGFCRPNQTLPRLIFANGRFTSAPSTPLVRSVSHACSTAQYLAPAVRAPIPSYYLLLAGSCLNASLRHTHSSPRCRALPALPLRDTDSISASSLLSPYRAEINIPHHLLARLPPPRPTLPRPSTHQTPTELCAAEAVLETNAPTRVFSPHCTSSATEFTNALERLVAVHASEDPACYTSIQASTEAHAGRRAAAAAAVFSGFLR